VDNVAWFLVPPFVWACGCIAGWIDIKIHYKGYVYPFSFRIFLGPGAYYRWVDKDRIRRELNGWH